MQRLFCPSRQAATTYAHNLLGRVNKPTRPSYTMSTATHTESNRDSTAAESETPFSVAKDIIQLLSQTKSTLGAAESLTAGGLMSAITSVPGASAVFRGGVVSYATELKKSLLSVDSDLIAREGVIHGEVAAQMAEGARKATSFPGGETTTWGVGTTGVAGPGLQDGKEAGTVYVGISYGGSQGSNEGEEGEQQWSKSVGPFKFKGGREEVRQQTILEALRALREAIRGY